MRWLRNLFDAWREYRRLQKQRREIRAARMGGHDYPSAWRRGISR